MLIPNIVLNVCQGILSKKPEDFVSIRVQENQFNRWTISQCILPCTKLLVDHEKDGQWLASYYVYQDTEGQLITMPIG